MPTYSLQREILMEEPYDLVVAGAGPAGCAAAVCAGRLGARVLLVEAMGCLGGMATSGLVTAFDPMANGERMIVGGFMAELVETMWARGFIPAGVTPDYWRKFYHRWTPFNAEGLKLLLDEMALAAPVEIRLFTRVIDADANAAARHVNGVVIQNIEGYRFVAAKTFVDATGDAVLADLCGAACREPGRDTPAAMPPTLCSLYAGIDWERAEKRHPDKFKNEQELLEKAIADGMFTQPDRHLPGMWKAGDQVGYLNAGHIFGVNALRGKDLTDAMILGRKLAAEYTAFYRKYMPGCEKIEHVTTASLLGVRESRRIVGEYELTLDDYMARRQFPDQIGVFNKFVDIHVHNTSHEEYERFLLEKDKYRLGEGEFFGIPYSILVPAGWDNLWVAGRCNSSDVPVHGSIRVQPAAAMMGQAVGTAATQAMRTGQPAGDLDTAALVEALREQGAYLPQTQLSRQMTRR
ncbi:MAG: FAD-dependent oxidoreductase [Chloroflexi bacterium]|nr:FAD-dependent oxidoreductase [Chloroflexota bacterium]